jgi:class 3 adenylate cyclase
MELKQERDALEKEKQKSDSLLLNILPSETAEELKKFGYASPKLFKMITVMFTDFVNFTRTSERLDAAALVQEIDFYYSAFDQIVTKYRIEKIKTIGDSYMCAGGLPVANSSHAQDVVLAAVEILQFVAFLNQQRKKQGLPTFECRIGIHSGPVVAGIVGIKKFAYDIWGDTVNIASRMESSSETMKINISGSTHELIAGSVPCLQRGKIEAKNKGLIDMYYIDTENIPAVRSYHSAESYLLDLVRRESMEQLVLARTTLASIGDAREKSVEQKRLAYLLEAAGKDQHHGLAMELLPPFGFDAEEIDTILAMLPSA